MSLYHARIREVWEQTSGEFYTVEMRDMNAILAEAWLALLNSSGDEIEECKDYFYSVMYLWAETLDGDAYSSRVDEFLDTLFQL